MVMHALTWAGIVALTTTTLILVRRHGSTATGFRLIVVFCLLLASASCTVAAIAYIESSTSAGEGASQGIVLGVFFFAFAVAALGATFFILHRMRLERQTSTTDSPS